MASDHTRPTERLWTPWRMRYVGGTDVADGCIFCNRLEGDNDIESLILHRGERSFVIMNLYPYNTGHIMLVPNQHASDPSELPTITHHELGEMLPILTTALRRVLGCEGFNVGLNIGATAGAGVANHLHQHIVPRWEGDANFMPILASTMVLPELIPVSYAKIRAELERAFTAATSASFVLLDSLHGRALVRNGSVPTVELVPEQPVWKCVVDAIPDGIELIEVAGWAGARLASDHNERIALSLQGRIAGALPLDWQLTSLDAGALDPSVTALLHRARREVAPGS